MRVVILLEKKAANTIFWLVLIGFELLCILSLLSCVKLSLNKEHTTSYNSGFRPVHQNIIEIPKLKEVTFPDPHIPYGHLIKEQANRNKIDWRLIAAVTEVESRFRKDAVSSKGAQGLMQVLPETAADYNVKEENLKSPAINLHVGSRHLSRLLRKYKGNVRLSLAAYNSGEGSVDKFHGVPPYSETKIYVEKVLHVYSTLR